jgi:hypothetical protein
MLLKETSSFNMLLCENVQWNKILYTNPWPVMYMYFYTTQLNIVYMLTHLRYRN